MEAAGPTRAPRLGPSGRRPALLPRTSPQARRRGRPRPRAGAPSTDPGLLFPLLPSSGGARPFSGSSFPGGLGGTRMRRRKMHFFFLISLPQRNLGVGRERRKLWSLSVHPPGEESQVLKTSLSASPDPELKSRAARGDPELAKPVGWGLRRLPPSFRISCVALLPPYFSASTSPRRPLPAGWPHPAPRGPLWWKHRAPQPCDPESSCTLPSLAELHGGLAAVLPPGDCPGDGQEAPCAQA